MGKEGNACCKPNDDDDGLLAGDPTSESTTTVSSVGTNSGFNDGGGAEGPSEARTNDASDPASPSMFNDNAAL